LKALTHPIVHIEKWYVLRRLAGVVLAHPGKIDFPMAVAGCAGIVCHHWRAALSLRQGTPQ
jgi:hypothetical protein